MVIKLSTKNEESLADLLARTSFSNHRFENLIFYPNLFLIDIGFMWLNKVIFLFRRMSNLINGQKTFRIQSKNLLLVLEK